MRYCKNNWKPNCDIHFYISVIGAEAFTRTPNVIQAGDTVIFTAMKYKDIELKQPIGPTYAEYYITSQDPITGISFAVTTRHLLFDNRGTIITSGTSRQRLRFDPTTPYGITIEVVNGETDIAITGGTGEYIGASGIYDANSIDTNLYKGKLLLKLP